MQFNANADTENTYLALATVLGGIRDPYIKDLIAERDYWKNKLIAYKSELETHKVYECDRCNKPIVHDDSYDDDNRYFVCDRCGNKLHERCNSKYGGDWAVRACSECNKRSCNHLMGSWCAAVVGGHHGCASYIKRCPSHKVLESNCPWKLNCTNCINCTINVCSGCIPVD
jgi:hypothetical protein